MQLALLLTLAGALPFVAGAATLWFGPAAYSPLVLQGIVTYAAVILSFLGGIQWGVGVSISDAAPKSAQSLFLLSVVPSILAWCTLFIDANNVKLIVAVFLFCFVWAVDALLHMQKLIPGWFFRVRSIITPLVVASLFAALPRA
jgi:hypothetical protein